MRWLALVLSAALLIGQGPSVAPIYTQNWSAGNSAFTSVPQYDRGTHGADPLYPELWKAFNVTVTGGAVDWNGVDDDYSFCGVALKTFPSFNAQTGSITVKYRPNATSISDAFFALLIHIGLGSNTPRIGIDFLLPPDNIIEVNAVDFNGAAKFDEVPFTFAADTDYTIRLCWKCGTPSGGFSAVANDGYLRLYINDDLIHTIEDFGLYIDSSTDNVIGGATDSYALFGGGGGLLGALDDISFDEAECGSAEPVVLPINQSDPCCASGGSGTTPGPILGDDPYRPLQPWTRLCDGGGIVPQVADLTDPESWL